MNAPVIQILAAVESFLTTNPRVAGVVLLVTLGVGVKGRNIFRAFAQWNPHNQIAIGATLSLGILLTLDLDPSFTRLLALPITGILVIVAYSYHSEKTILDYFTDLSGLTQVTIFSIPIAVVVYVTNGDIVDILAVSYPLLGLAMVAIILLYFKDPDRFTR